MRTNKNVPKIDDNILQTWLQQLADDVLILDRYKSPFKTLLFERNVISGTEMEYGRADYDVIGIIPITYPHPLSIRYVKQTNKRTVVALIDIDGASSANVQFLLIAK